MTEGPPARTDWVRSALERYEQPLLRYAVRFTGDMDQARDVVQDTFLRLCQAERAKVDGHLAAWLYTVCRNRALDVRKKEDRMNPVDTAQIESVDSGGPGPAAVAERHETRSLVLEALDGLSDEHREAFRLKFEDDLTYREISQVMGVSLGKVSNLMAAALDTVRRRLRAGDHLGQEA